MLTKRLPRELYVIFIPCCVFLILSIFFFPRFLALLTYNILDLSAFTLIIKGGILQALGISFLILGGGVTLSYFFRKNAYSLKDYIKSFGYFICIVGIPGFFYSSLAFYLFTHVDIPTTINYSLLFSHYDQSIFGQDVFFALRFLQRIPLLEYLILYSYTLLVPVISACLLVLYIFKPHIFRKFIATFFLIMTLSIPLWAAFPAVAPASLFLTNIFRLPLSSTLQQTIENDRITPLLREKLTEQNQLYFDPTLRNINTSTNPSMHAAWGFLLALYVWKSSRRLKWIGVLYAVLNAVGALYIGQHYSIDILTGGCITIIAFFIIEKVFSTEKTESDLGPLYTISTSVRRIIDSLRY